MRKRRKRKKRMGVVGAGEGVGQSLPSAGAEAVSWEAGTRDRGQLAERREGAWGRSGEGRDGRTRKGTEGVAAPLRGTNRHMRNPVDWTTRRLSCRY